MPSDHQPSAALLTSAPTPAGPLADVVAVLSGVIKVAPENIDARQSFRFLGLDSLLAVEFVAGVNARCGIPVKADALSAHATPASFARYVGELRSGRPVPAGQPLGGVPGPEGFPYGATVSAAAPARARATVSVPPLAPPPSAVDREVLVVLREELARLLRCDPWDLDVHAPFPVLGVDSILGSEFVETVNRFYGTTERAAALGTHPSLAALAAHLTALTTRPAASSGVDMVLDAVRGDLLTIEQALVLLSRRA
ncbi:phosphopantetheine-binding protein [Streptomyces sp. NPDC057137]|uniref:phosphopantetheine-binding protein n=1 Tax=Streptomyces sp. NPDC057137 TaxID=3346030 RepID=UPI00363BCDD5